MWKQYFKAKYVSRAGMVGLGLFGCNEGWKEYSPLSIYHNKDWDKHVRGSLDSYSYEDNVKQFVGHGTSMIVMQLEPQNNYSKSIMICNPICLPEDQMFEIEEMGKIDVILVPNRGCRRDLRAWTERYPSALVVCPQKIYNAVTRIADVDKTTEKLFSRYWRGIKVHEPVGKRNASSNQVIEYNLDCTNSNKHPLKRRKALLITGILGYYSLSNINIFRNYLLRVCDGVPTISKWSEKILLNNPESFGLWLESLAMEISPELLLILNQSHPIPCIKPYFNEDPVKVITGVVHHGALNVPYPNVFTSFPDLSQEEQITELGKRILEVQSNHNINMDVPKTQKE